MRAAALALLLALAAPGAPEDPLAGARARLEDAAFEEALSTLDGVLARQDLDPDTRVEARILRSQALVALGATSKAEAEWAAILDDRPGFRPDRAGVPAKAWKRFEALRAAKVGTVRLDVDPADAGLTLDGRSVRLDPDSTLSVLAGTHVLRGERSGFDPAEATLAVGAAGTVDLVLRLSPNARTVVLQAEPPGVEVLLDGDPVGHTAVPAEGGPPVLILADVPLGDHAFDLQLACHRAVHVEELLAVDMLDRSPRRLGPFRLESARGTLTASGLPGATLLVDGKEVGVLPLGPFEACAGPRRLEVVRAGRRVWAGMVDVTDGEREPLALAARPNLVVVGGEAPSWASAWSVETKEAPVGFDPTAAESWRGLEWPRDADLAWTPGAVWSPWLQAIVPLGPETLLHGPPARSRTTIGIGLADGDPWGAARIVRLRPDGPAARAGARLGERLVALGGRPIASAKEAEMALAAATDPVLELSLEGGPAGARRLRVETDVSPLLLPPPADGATAALRAAWAAAESAARPDDAGAAADLAIALAAAGREEAAIERWRALRWTSSAGIGEGTAAYFLGRALQAAGKEEEAAAILGRAAASHATAESDDGPALAPAAASRP